VFSWVRAWLADFLDPISDPDPMAQVVIMVDDPASATAAEEPSLAAIQEDEETLPSPPPPLSRQSSFQLAGGEQISRRGSLDIAVGGSLSVSAVTGAQGDSGIAVQTGRIGLVGLPAIDSHDALDQYGADAGEYMTLDETMSPTFARALVRRRAFYTPQWEQEEPGGAGVTRA
jgi:hypothetical protein